VYVLISFGIAGRPCPWCDNGTNAVPVLKHLLKQWLSAPADSMYQPRITRNFVKGLRPTDGDWTTDRAMRRLRNHWNATDRPVSHRMMTDEEEKAFVTRFDAEVWEPGIRLLTGIFTAEAAEGRQKDRRHADNLTKFSRSHSFRVDFMRRHFLTHRTLHIKHQTSNILLSRVPSSWCRRIWPGFTRSVRSLSQ
jgi:hypothetical protein